MIHTSVTISHKTRLAPDVIEVTFTHIPPEFVFQPGQYLSVILPQLEGAHITDQFHEFSIVARPTNSQIAFVYRDSPSLFKSTLASLEAGATVIIEGPFGNFTLPEADDRPLVFIAAGVGIAPILTILRAAHHAKRQQPMILYYLNSRHSQAIYVDELTELARDMSLTIHHLTEHFDKLAPAALRQHPENALWYVVGPPMMTKKTQQFLVTCGIVENNIFIEGFTGYE